MTITAADALAGAREIIEADDAAGFAKLADELGIALELAAFKRYLVKSSCHFVPGTGELGLKMIHAALQAPHGYAYEQYIDAYTVLAVRVDDRIVFGACESTKTKPFKRWTMSPRWYKDPARNGPTVANWVADPKRALDTLSIPVVRAPVVAPPSDAGAALLAAVIADPDDLGARLVYGDWLVEQGDVRGELIRVQCDLAGTLDAKRRAALEQREEKLLGAYHETIVAPVAPYTERADIVRGLVGKVEIYGDKLLTRGEAIFAAHPITELRMMVKDAAQFARLATLPIYGKLSKLRIEGRAEKRVTNSSTELELAVGATTMFQNLRALHVQHCDDTQADWKKLFQTIAAPRLELLDVQEHLDEAAMLALADSDGMPALKDLTLFAPKPRASTVSVAKRLARRATLESVMLYRWGGTDESLAKYVAALLAAPALVDLEVYWCKPAGPLALRAIEEHGARLERFEIYRPGAIDLAGLAQLVAALPALRTLEIEDVQGDDAACEALARAICEAPALVDVTWHASIRGCGQATKAQAKRILAAGRSFAGRLRDS